ncbi:hypothetical protein AW14_01590 [Siansivirga zeaxanthinifaciens CC-SAMT-1]|uniref:DM13 domain-containing protein n=2 Tax=Siansivirga TaxID=1204360 RepID=A0A0C5WHS9_9FLAO|nr:hypothetical protein AW14_01590 [Siansivirga zeaxanthinifaciens CC-SAMT-1]
MLQQIIFAQCTVSATNFGNNTTSGYAITGDVSITLNTNNTLTLNLGSNFSTASGPDVRAYLVKSNGASNTALAQSRIANLERIEFGLVACSGCNPVISPNGQKSFTVAIPNGVVISEYDRVFFYCLQFNAFWDLSSFNSFNSSNCAILSTDNSAFNDFTIYPNPVQNDIQIKSPISEEIFVEIYNILGKKVYSQITRTNSNINVSTLKSGLHILSISSRRGKVSKKIQIN